MSAAYLAAFRDPHTIHAVCEDYRANASVDLAHDTADREAGRRIAVPLLALWEQPAGFDLPFDPLAIWRRWAADVRAASIACGHHVAEEAPEELVGVLRKFLDR